MKYHEIQSNTIHYYAMQSSAMKYFAIECNRFNYNTIPCNPMQYNETPSNTMQLNIIQYNTLKYPVISCNNIEYNIIPCNTMKYYATLLFSDFQYFFKSHLYFISINNNTNCFTCLVRLLDYWACWRSIQSVPDLHGAKKGHFGPKRSLLGSLAAQKRPNISQKTEQPVAVGTKSGPRGPPRTSKAT